MGKKNNDKKIFQKKGFRQKNKGKSQRKIREIRRLCPAIPFPQRKKSRLSQRTDFLAGKRTVINNEFVNQPPVLVSTLAVITNIERIIPFWGRGRAGSVKNAVNVNILRACCFVKNIGNMGPRIIRNRVNRKKAAPVNLCKYLSVAAYKKPSRRTAFLVAGNCYVIRLKLRLDPGSKGEAGGDAESRHACIIIAVKTPSIAGMPCKERVRVPAR